MVEVHGSKDIETYLFGLPENFKFGLSSSGKDLQSIQRGDCHRPARSYDFKHRIWPFCNVPCAKAVYCRVAEKVCQPHLVKAISTVEDSYQL